MSSHLIAILSHGTAQTVLVYTLGYLFEINGKSSKTDSGLQILLLHINPRNPPCTPNEKTQTSNSLKYILVSQLGKTLIEHKQDSTTIRPMHLYRDEKPN